MISVFFQCFQNLFNNNCCTESVFEDQLQENFHNSQSGYNKTSAPRRDMIGLAQWLDRASSEIFGFKFFIFLKLLQKNFQRLKIFLLKNNCSIYRKFIPFV